MILKYEDMNISFRLYCGNKNCYRDFLVGLKIESKLECQQKSEAKINIEMNHPKRTS